MWDESAEGLRELRPSAFPPVGGKQYIPFKVWSEHGTVARRHCHWAGQKPVVVIDLEVTADQYLHLELGGFIEWDACHEGWRCECALPLYMFSCVVHDHLETAGWEEAERKAWM